MVMTVRIHEYGGPEVLRYEDVPIGSPGPGEDWSAIAQSVLISPTSIQGKDAIPSIACRTPSVVRAVV